MAKPKAETLLLRVSADLVNLVNNSPAGQVLAYSETIPIEHDINARLKPDLTSNRISRWVAVAYEAYHLQGTYKIAPTKNPQMMADHLRDLASAVETNQITITSICNREIEDSEYRGTETTFALIETKK